MSALKKKKPLLANLDFGCFPGMIAFSCGASYEEIHKSFEKNSPWQVGLESHKEAIEKCFGLGCKSVVANAKTGKVTLCFYIILKDFSFRRNDHIAILAHEITHINQFYLKDILDRNREFEAEAHLHTHIMIQCLKELRKWKR
ncbi:hypothetical protein [Leptospira interrogans]|uniref:hypothetical protein n=1 Tax=Leptospira interrogans TaxID=173 RepID=UPI0002BB28BE|nr:hypothetical protein [Leptospira interrogans]